MNFLRKQRTAQWILITKASIIESQYPKPGSLALRFELTANSQLPLEFQLWLSELTRSTSTATDSEFFIPANTLFARIEDFKTLRARNGKFPLVYDEFFERLVDRYKDETERLVYAVSNPQACVPASEVRKGLRTAKFLRWDSQSIDQLRDIGRLAFLPNGANFSVPGAGKTNTLLAVHALAKLATPELKLIVVCPKNAMVAWDEEVAACLGLDKAVVRLEGNSARISKTLGTGPEYSVISYQKLVGAVGNITSFMRSNDVHLVLDESHRIKAGNNSQQGTAAIALADDAHRRDILSGTPMPQGISDLESQFAFLWPQLTLFKSIAIDQESSQQIRQANRNIKPYFVRTTKSELGLPKPRIRNLSVEMSPLQEETWKLLKDESARYIAGLDPKDKEEMRAIGKQIMRVLQFCSEPALLLSKLPVSSHSGELQNKLERLAEETSSKTLALDRLVKSTMDMPGEKVVVWSMFVDQIKNLEKRYADYGATSIHGGIQTGPSDDMAFREARIARFKSDVNCRVLVANPSACGEGISLHKEAHHAIYFDRSFNAAHFLQSIDRIHRRGLPEGAHTRVDILCLQGTIEEAVRQRLSDKIGRLQQLLDDDDLSAMVYDPEDVDAIGEGEAFDMTDMEAIKRSLSK